MSDIMPEGLTKKSQEPENKLLQSLNTILENTSDKSTRQLSIVRESFKESLEKLTKLKKSVDDQVAIMTEGGMSNDQIQEYLKETLPLLNSQTERYLKRIEKVRESIKDYAEKTDFESLEQAQIAKKALDDVGTFQKEEQKNQSKFLEKITGAVENAYDKSFNSFLGPLQLVTAPFEDLTGISIGNELKKAFFGDKEKISPKRNVLLKHGVEGSAAVFLADQLGASFDKSLQDVELKTDSSFTNSIASFVKALGPAAIGLSAFAALKWDDITGGFSQIASGDVVRGVETLLLGDRERITERTAEIGVGKQATAYGLATAGIATTGAMFGGASLGSAIVGAFPPAAVAAVIAGFAKGIQTAYVLEWDQNAEQETNNLRSIIESDSASFWDKLKASFGLFFRRLFSPFAGGLRNIVDRAREGFGSIWQDEESSITSKIGDSIKQYFSSTLFAGVDFLKGFISTGVDYLFAAMPDSVKSFFTKVKEFFVGVIDTVKDFLFGIRDKFGEFFRNAWNRSINFISNTLIGDLVDKIKGFFTGIVDYLGNFWESILNTDFSGVINEAVDNITGQITGFFSGFSDRVGEFFGSIWNKITGNDSEPSTSTSSSGGMSFIDNKSGSSSIFSGANSLDNITSVEDAIIKPNGQIIHTSPEDTILATKNDPTIIENRIDREVSQTSTVLSSSNINYSSKFDTMIEYLSKLIEVTSKSGKSIISNTVTPSFNFANLRLGEN